MHQDTLRNSSRRGHLRASKEQLSSAISTCGSNHHHKVPQQKRMHQDTLRHSSRGGYLRASKGELSPAMNPEWPWASPGVLSMSTALIKGPKPTLGIYPGHHQQRHQHHHQQPKGPSYSGQTHGAPQGIPSIAGHPFGASQGRTASTRKNHQ